MFKAFKRLFAVLSFALVATSAHAQATKINLGYVAAGDWLPALVAKDMGFFEKRNLDVTLTKVAIISNIPSAILAGNLNVGVSTPTVLIDAVDAGLPLVGIAGATRFVRSPAIFSVVVKQGVTATSAKDLEGKRVGVPGLRSIADVLFRKWLLDKGVNPSRVTIVETPFPQMKDLLKGGTVDAVAVLEPFRSNIVNDNVGFRLADYVAEVNPNVLGGMWIAQREWAAANPRAVTAFREALAESIEFIKTRTEEARVIEAKYLGFRTPVLLPYELTVTNADLETYVRYSRDVGYLTKPVDVGQMLAR
jgi:NitT/TauT family transport system substrate-binding protein